LLIDSTPDDIMTSCNESQCVYLRRVYTKRKGWRDRSIALF
jgi:hypothetical protein